MERAGELHLIGDIVREAGEIAMRYFRADNRVWTKAGDSPVSEADMAVDRFLKKKLLAAVPDAGWLSEESVDEPDRLQQPRIFVVDPIDGTRGFIKGDPNWCISVAIVSAAGPEIAVLHCPARDLLYGGSRDCGSWLDGKPLRMENKRSVRSIAGSHHINKAVEKSFPKRFDIHPFLPSLAFRMAMVASGELDAAFASRGSHEWDVAAADLIIREAGGTVTTVNGEALRYNSHNVRMPALVASGAGLHEAAMDIAKSGGFLH